MSSIQVINSIFIENIGINTSPSSVAKLFYNCQIAIVKQVTIFPEYDAKQKQLNHNAYINVEWLDTEQAYRFLSCIKKPVTEARLFYTDANYWVVKKNPMPSSFAPSKWTITFENPETKFFQELEEDEQTMLMQALKMQDQIQLEAN